MYAKLLTGEKVFDRVHPLLTDSQDAKNSYVILSHGFDAQSLLFPKARPLTENPDALFLAEAVVDLDSTSGREMAASFIETMDALQEGAVDGDVVSVAYRILPSTVPSASGPLCTSYHMRASLAVLHL